MNVWGEMHKMEQNRGSWPLVPDIVSQDGKVEKAVRRDGQKKPIPAIATTGLKPLIHSDRFTRR
jgi:hypothetical protein